eukprot:693622-Prymnesium_polylepis.1
MIANRCPFKESEGDTEGDESVRELVQLNAWLPAVLGAMRRALAGLEAKCVAPSRSNVQQASSNREQAIQLRKQLQGVIGSRRGGG